MIDPAPFRIDEAAHQLAKAIAADAVQQFIPMLLNSMKEHFAAEQPDPILNLTQAAKHLGISKDKLSQLVAGGWIKRLPGFIDPRFRQSTLDAYGKQNK